MCDTLGFTKNGRAVFAKNSDRSPNEPQVLEYIPAEGKKHAVFLSRPTWLWGAEMGVNDCGVCIGNEAVWTLGKYGKDGLKGMDLLRLALEQAGCAKDALGVLTEQLEEHGQGGNCGFDHEFYYDNSFLVMDRKNLFVLETAAKEWVWKKYDRVSISNRLSIGADGDEYSGERCNFALKHTEHLYNIASGSASRRRMTERALKNAKSAAAMMHALRQHAPGAEPFVKGSVGSVCMHYGGLVGDHTTSSLVADLYHDKTVIWATGGSCPCVSLFKPYIFGSEPNKAMLEGEAYWRRREEYTRSLIGKALPDDYFEVRDALEFMWMKKVEQGDREVFSRCFDEEEAFFRRWSRYEFEPVKTSAGFDGRWAKKNAAL